jgi:hypothetical protein
VKQEDGNEVYVGMAAQMKMTILSGNTLDSCAQIEQCNEFIALSSLPLLMSKESYFAYVHTSTFITM